MSLQFKNASVPKKILRKHILEGREPFERLCPQLPEQARRSRDSPETRPQVLHRIEELVIKQGELSAARPLYVERRVRRWGGAPTIEQLRVGPSGLLVIVDRDEHGGLILSAYFKDGKHDWKLVCRWILDTYCEAQGGGYQLPDFDRVFPFNQKEQRREDRVRLHQPKTFGILLERVTRGSSISFPQWHEAERYDLPRNPSVSIKRAVRPRPPRNPSKPRSL